MREMSEVWTSLGKEFCQMAKEYNYKRYQLSLDENDLKQKQIIEYLETFKAGKARNSAMVRLLIAGTGEKIEPDALPVMSPAYITTENRLKKMDGKLDEILWNLINRYGFKDVEDLDVKESEEVESKEQVINLAATKTEDTAIADTIEEEETYIQKQTLDKDREEDTTTQPTLPSAFGMSENSIKADTNEDNTLEDDFDIPEDIQAFLESL